MTSPSITYAEVEARLDHPIDAVWLRIAAFGGLQHWADGVSDCTVEGAGVGAVRTVTRNGNTVCERLEAIDAEARTLRYQILPPHPLPADDVHGNVALTALDNGATKIVWRSDATNFRAPPEALGARIADFYQASIDGLSRLLNAD